MMSFWIFAAILVVIALAYVIPPLLERVASKDDDSKRANVAVYRDQFDELDQDLRDGVLDQEQYAQGRLELQRRLLEDVTPAQDMGAATETPDKSRKTTAILVGSAIPVFAVLLYYQIGTPKSLDTAEAAVPLGQRETRSEAPPAMPGQPTQEEIENRVAKLAARLKEDPNDAAGWAMLARSYHNFKRYQEASDAYAKATQLVSNDAQLWADYADALAMASNSELQGRPMELINRSLQLDPQNNKALWLAGTAAFEAEDFEKALSYWERLQKLLPEGSAAARSIGASIEEARGKKAGVGEK